jgi:hypothetical protein
MLLGNFPIKNSLQSLNNIQQQNTLFNRVHRCQIITSNYALQQSFYLQEIDVKIS